MALRKPPLAKPGEVNYPMIDRFTFVHFAIGIFYAIIGVSFGWTFVFVVLWELVENPVKVYMSFLFPHATADTLQNSVCDILASLAGWLCVRWIVA